MSDLIERRAAIDEIKEYFKFSPLEGRHCAKVIERVPSAQPRRGKWIKISPANIYECSECGKNVMTDDISAYDFCHGCGADMRGEQE